MGAAAKKVIETPWLTTPEAAEYCRMEYDAFMKQIQRGNLAPDSWGGRGRTQGHRFRRETLDRFLEGK